MIFEELKDKEILLIDYFDTIVHRNVHPENVKMIWAKNLYEELIAKDDSLKEDAYDIFNIRKESEDIVRKNGSSRNENNYEEVCNTIYDKISSELSISKKQFFEKSLDVEIRVECDVQYLDKESLVILKKAHSDQKNVILISDFYLPAEAFVKFLNYHGIAELIDELYISHDYDLRKDTEGLYKKVLEKYDKNTILMYGDNQFSDYNIPNKLGVKAVLKPSVEFTKAYKDKKYIEKLIKNLTQRSEKVGPYVGYFLQLYLFCEKLYLECIKNDYKKLFFLSREGKRLKEVFDLYTNKKIETHYLMTSRYSMLEAKENSEKREEFVKYFSSFGLDSDEKIILIDIGWKGTMQSLMSEIIPNHTVGYYLGLNEQTKTNDKCVKKGLLFSPYPSKSNYYGTYTFNSLLEEQLLVADHGSVSGYKNGKAICFEDENNRQIYEHLSKMRMIQNKLIVELYRN